MKTLYLDLASGISGDMFVGALLDLGVSFGDLTAGLGKLGLTGYHLHVQRGHRAGISGVKFDVHVEGMEANQPGGESGEAHGHAGPHVHGHEHEHGHGHVHPDPDVAGHTHSRSPGHAHASGGGQGERTFATIRGLIDSSPLSGWVRERATAVFRRIAEAEGRIHGLAPEAVHFHEVGALDSILDIVGGCLALEALGRPRVLASSVVEGTGYLHCAHGRYPLPGPAALAILGTRGIAVTQCGEPHEMVTPTGAALLAELAEGFGPMRGLVAERIGYGLGSRDHPTRPNALRAILGRDGVSEAGVGGHDWERDAVVVLETNLDDVSGEVVGDFMARALAGGVLDVFATPVQMKKQRPGVQLSLVCAEGEAERWAAAILRETSAFGVRWSRHERWKLRRAWQTVRTLWGEVPVKLGWLDGRVVQAAPEYEVCRRLAEDARVPLKAVYEAALRALPDPAQPGPTEAADSP